MEGGAAGRESLQMVRQVCHLWKEDWTGVAPDGGAALGTGELAGGQLCRSSRSWTEAWGCRAWLCCRGVGCPRSRGLRVAVSVDLGAQFPWAWARAGVSTEWTHSVLRSHRAGLQGDPAIRPAVRRVGVLLAPQPQPGRSRYCLHFLSLLSTSPRAWGLNATESRPEGFVGLKSSRV